MGSGNKLSTLLRKDRPQVDGVSISYGLLVNYMGSNVNLLVTSWVEVGGTQPILLSVRVRLRLGPNKQSRPATSINQPNRAYLDVGIRVSGGSE